MRYLTAYLLLSVGVSLTAVSCGGDTEEPKKQIDETILDPKKALNTVFDGKIFSVPSPVQTSMLIKNLDLPFSPILTNPVENLEGYTTEYQKALNLGVYGTDLGYVALYQENSLSITYLAAVQKITELLNLQAAFDKSFLERFEANISNQDSMVMIVSEAFKKSDNFLKNSNRMSTSALILTGGWIESMYFACELNMQKPSKDMVKRIGEQKITLNTIIDLLKEYNTNNANDELILDMQDLQFYFDQILFDYTYHEPTTNAKKKLTTLNHEINITIDTSVMNQISMKVRSIREKITK